LCLSDSEHRPVQDDVMEQAFREHADLTSYGAPFAAALANTMLGGKHRTV
jgi:hypothetical protein